jgi:phosphoribosylanthranilate isomerase
LVIGRPITAAPDPVAAARAIGLEIDRARQVARSMTLRVKICGLRDPASVEAAVLGGAGLVGFVFFPPSPRSIEPELAAALAASVPKEVLKVAVTVDPDDELIDRICGAVPLDAIQLHGAESPERVSEIRERTGRRVIKALRIADAADLRPVAAFARSADMLLFDAKPPKRPDALPGGNGLAFDWRLLDGMVTGRPWLLSGGLYAGNLAQAVRLCRPAMVDVSSGVETRPGVKDPAMIRTFLNLAATLSPAGSQEEPKTS